MTKILIDLATVKQARHALGNLCMHPGGAMYLQDLYNLDAALEEAKNLSPTHTSGHCKNKARPGGCHLHNLQCSYPECDRVKE
jgi:hypothetical protein